MKKLILAVMASVLLPTVAMANPVQKAADAAKAAVRGVEARAERLVDVVADQAQKAADGAAKAAKAAAHRAFDAAKALVNAVK